MSNLERRGSWYLNCPECRADAHIVGHNRTAGKDNAPLCCPFCGSGEADITPEVGDVE